ncbi:MAG: hypothetical protein AAF585_07000 [Verrucomicrobiota bacterium]
MTSIRPVIVGFLVVLLGGANAGELLYNGIQLPDEWPPKYAEIPRADQSTPPYLEAPPEIIPIDLGRQLFVDDFLIEETTLERTFHQPKWNDGNPVLKPEHPAAEIGGKNTPMAAPFSDGVWWDGDRFKMWYLARNYFTSYAESIDGITWTKPPIPGAHYEGANTLINYRGDSSTTWIDHNADPSQRFVMLTWRATQLHLRYSADGTTWGDPFWSSGRGAGDRTTFFYNPFRKVWVYSLRKGRNEVGRCRFYTETSDLSQPPDIPKAVRWTRADDLDRVQPVIGASPLPDLYNLDATPYESLMLGFFAVHSVEHNEYPNDSGQPKVIHVSLGYSRDGFHWSRPDRRPFLNCKPEDRTAWNRGNVQSAGGGCLVVEDKLYFYCSGRIGGKTPDDGSGMSTGLAFLRRDGFASMDANESGGQLTTRLVQFSGNHLYANLDGELKVALLDSDGEVLAVSNKISEDSTKKRIDWVDVDDLSAFANQQLRFRFHLAKGRLFSFWTSDKSGASRGYVAAGGPGYSSGQDR